MVEGVTPPWLRATRHKDSKTAPWLYCIDCRERYFQNGRKPEGHIPYRDKASQSMMKKMHEKECVAQQDLEVASQFDSHGTQEEPEVEPAAEESAAVPVADQYPDVDGVHAGIEVEDEKSDNEEERQNMDVDPEAEIPDTVYPSLDEYKEKWATALARHSMAVPGDFSTSNLVPEPISQVLVV